MMGSGKTMLFPLGLAVALVPNLAIAQNTSTPEESFLAYIFEWVVHDGVAEGLALSILFVLVLVVICLGKVWWTSTQILEFFKKKILDISHDPLIFAERYLELENELSGSQYRQIQHAWKEFKECTFVDNDDTGSIRFHNTIPPESFFTPERLGINFSVFRASANYFVGVGLLLTFFGLAAVLYYATQGINQGDTDIQKALSSLLGAATLKFMTSIAGLFSSIIISVLALRASSHVSRLCSEICQELEVRFQFAIQEKLAVEHLKEAREQTAALKRFSTDLAMSIAEPVKSGVISAMTPLQNEIKNLADSVIQGGKEGVDKITEGIPQKIEDAANIIANASVNLQSASGELERITSSLERKISEAGTAFGETMSGASSNVANTVSGIGTQVSSLQDSMAGLDNILDAHRDKFQELVNATHNAASALDTAADRHARAAQPIADAADRISTAAGTIQELGRIVQETHQSLASIHAQIKESNAELNQFWQAHDGRFSDVDQELAHVVNRIIEGNSNYQTSVTAFVTELASKLGDALNHLSAAIQDFGEVTENTQSRNNER